ncbi:sugar lactone lactonase YvrE [Roseimicrobium gellanilyticum]|uniref:Sugar lactone lactonase YvrE n=1 Tax=Roseimicrobium gellanilyticum TaxID=748857 RepID=A0A366HSF7_9BACT|nr:SMP-30/gluconolactonase/LRE family protein [Roseimicrobium gellanilyticum]RBP47216.1 sugar lactone lactonase YvrE [Roseimicrobium gellanilyticum]
MRSIIALLALAIVGNVTAQDTSTHAILIEGEDWKEAVTGQTFTDGLCATEDGSLLFTDVRVGKGIYKLGLDGKVTLMIDEQPGISGLALGPDGRIYACQNKASRVVVFEKDGTVKELMKDVKPNDLIVTKKGFVYFTETGTKRIHGIAPDGKTFVADEGHVLRPNGITLSADQTTLAVSEHGGKNVWSWQIQPDGKLVGGAPNMTMQVSPNNAKGEALGDGSTTDAAGRYYVTSELGIQVFDATGRHSGTVALPFQGAKIVSVEFAGPNHEWLFVCAGDRIFKRKTQTQGAWQKPVQQ